MNHEKVSRGWGVPSLPITTPRSHETKTFSFYKRTNHERTVTSKRSVTTPNEKKKAPTCKHPRCVQCVEPAPPPLQCKPRSRISMLP
ncbi:hypothetical protein BU26DRAFT_341050 [Trematosphaeria pertusa]|uniref:Uncharacterized protein n=1 Tax=Trematosphaeria pertusa TaxID=390896 RepID=A0A6A6I926_9PLEO|nr:uncharacterized protein BU26DRAFT_341050 [Trematosphaeria pertusa]KAF2247065.1 hypothetical protein BU26DRAFT_341050 [Trematosphaeria pertusa]